MRPRDWPVVVALMLVGAGCDRTEEAPASPPLPAEAAKTDAGTTAISAPPPAAQPDAVPDPALEAVAETLEIERLTPGVYWCSDEVAREVLYATSTGAWTIERREDGFELHTAGAPRLATRLGLGDGDVITKLGKDPVGPETTAREAYEALTRTGGVIVELRRDGGTRRLLLRQRTGRRTRPKTKATAKIKDMLRMSIVASEAPSVERAVLVALGTSGAPTRGAELVLEQLGLPATPTAVAIDGASVDPAELAQALADHADGTSMSLLVDASEITVTIAPSSIEAADLSEQLSKLSPFDSARFPRGAVDPLDPDPLADPVPMPVDTLPVTRGITSPSEGHIELKRSLLESWLDDPAALAKAARVVPNLSGGMVTGYKLYGIRSGSIPKALGFKNGDKLTKIAGTQLDSIDKAMDAYTKLRKAKTIEVEFERKGKRLTLEIEIK